MKVRFYKINIFISTPESKEKADLGQDILNTDYQESILYMVKDQLAGITWNPFTKRSYIFLKGVEDGFISPLMPKDIMKLKLIEYDSEKPT